MDFVHWGVQIINLHFLVIFAFFIFCIAFFASHFLTCPVAFPPWYAGGGEIRNCVFLRIFAYFSFPKFAYFCVFLRIFSHFSVKNSDFPPPSGSRVRIPGPKKIFSQKNYFCKNFETFLETKNIFDIAAS